MAGPGEFELQLGHLCNDRCVFCESGRLTHAGRAPLLAVETLSARVREAYAAGHRRITFLGGEPTIQPSFLPIVRLAVDLGFESIVIFSNGSRAGSSDLVDLVLATGGRFEWRFSVQGATAEAHARTTGRKSGFRQVIRALSVVRDRGQRARVNLCLVRQNCDALDRFAELLVPLGVSQVHVDMLNPDDMGGIVRDEEVTAMMPRYSDVSPILERMVRGFPEGFDVSVGGLPFCIAPSLAPWIHHDHHPMWTVTAQETGTPALKPARYLCRRSDKLKPDACTSCVFDERCTGVFRAYAERFGTGELRSVSHEDLAASPTHRRLVALHLRPWLRSGGDLAPWVSEVCVEEPSLREVCLTLRATSGGELRLLFRDTRADAIATSDWCAVHVETCTVAPAEALAALRELWSRLEASGMHTVVPPGLDGFASLHPAVARRLQRLRDRAPFADLVWSETRVCDEGGRVEVTFHGPCAETATVWLAARGKKSSGGYDVGPSPPTPAMVDGLRAVLAAMGAAPRQAPPGSPSP
jgi:MoaA/NifB/PqqE/SkfB family radical SAM enzyme